MYLYAVFFLMGVLSGLPWFSADEGASLRVQLLFAIAISLGCMWYCTADARLLGRPLLPIARAGIFTLWPAGVPIYLLWARRLRGLGILLLYGAALLLTCVVAAFATAYLTYGDRIFE